MGSWGSVLVGAAIALGLYALFVLALVIAGRRQDARALAGFLPDCVVLVRRLLADERVPAGRKFLLGALIAYLVLPFDLVPDFIPVAGQMDDAILLALVLRLVLRSGGPTLLRELWPGPAPSLNVLLRIAYGRAGSAAEPPG